MKKLVALVLALVMVAACFIGCEKKFDGTDMEYIQDKGKLIVGITDYAPMDYKDDKGEWTGFDAELARMVAKDLDVECEFYVLADWGKKFMELDSKNIDCVWNGMTITDEATSNASVSMPYVLNAQVLVMKADKVAEYTTADSIKDLTVAVEDGSAGADAAEAAGVKNVVKKQDQAGALLEVKSGTSDACIIDITMAEAMTGEGTDYADLAKGISLTEEEYGIAFRKDSDMTAKVNELLKKYAADGTLQKLAEKYELTLSEDLAKAK